MIYRMVSLVMTLSDFKGHCSGYYRNLFSLHSYRAYLQKDIIYRIRNQLIITTDLSIDCFRHQLKTFLFYNKTVYIQRISDIFVDALYTSKFYLLTYLCVGDEGQFKVIRDHVCS